MSTNTSIVINTTHITISPYTPGDSKTLERSLSVWDKATYSVTFRAMYYDSDTKTLTIPSTYSYNLLRKYFPTYTIIDRRLYCDPYATMTYKLLLPPRDAKQKECLDFLNSEGKFSNTSIVTQKLVCLLTGQGKTYIAINYAASLGRRTIIFVDQENLGVQWLEAYKKFTDIKDDEIYYIAGSSNIDKLMSSKSIKYKVFIASHRTFMAYCKSNPEMVHDILLKLKIGLKIYDEAHVEWKNTFMIDAHSNTSMTLYLTATVGRSNPTENIVYNNMYKDLTQYGIEERSHRLKYHKVVYVSYNTHPSDKINIKVSSNKRGFNVNAYIDYILKERYDQYYNMIKSLIDYTLKGLPTAKIAIFICRLDLLELVAKDLNLDYPSLSLGILTSGSKQSKQEALNSQLIVTTDKSFGKAIDVIDLNVIINTVPLSSKIKLEQLIGRLRYVEGKVCIYYDITDIGISASNIQQSHRRRLLNTIAKDVYKLSL